MLEEFKSRMERSVNGLGWGDPKAILELSLVVGALLFSGSMLFAEGAWRGIFGAMSILPILAAYSVPTYFWSARQREIESCLPQVLYRIASNAFLPMEEMVGELARGRGALASEFGMAHMQMGNGVAVDLALEGIAERNDSRLLKRTISMLLESHRTGADMETAFKETAEEMEGIASVVRTLAASTTIEKYTLLLAGGAIVPLVLGTLISLVGSMDFAGLAEMGFGSAGGELLSSAALGSQVYILEYAILASAFVAYQEGGIEKTVVYAAVLVPLSMALFMAASSGIFI